FLEFSRPPTLVFRPTAVRSLVDDLLMLYRHQLIKNNVAVEVDVPLDLPQVHVDPDQIKQVFLNLLANAVDAIQGMGRNPPGGAIMITADTTVSPEGHGELVFLFRDDGPGIPAESRAHIFDAFYTTKTTGTGLGLAISSRIMKNHGGSLALESDATAGTTFVVRIPINDGDET
ncbi:MAG: sensor histidine kinase, partial [Planctomycetota bacterium]